MKLILEINGGNQFQIQVGNNDSLHEMKEKVERYLGIPIPKQTLSFNGNILADELDLLYADIKDGSLLHLQIIDSAQPPQHITIMLKMPPPFKSFNLEVAVHKTIGQLREKIQFEFMELTSNNGGRIVIKHQNGMELPDHITLHDCQLLLYPEVTVELRPQLPKMDLQFQIAGSDVVTVKTSIDDTVLQLKEKIQNKEGTPIGQISILNENGMELPDHKTLHDCGVSLESRITVEFLPSPPPRRKKSKPTSTSSSSMSQPMPPMPPPPWTDDMRIVLEYHGVRRTTEVRAAQKVSQVRTKLEKMNIQLPEKYFFIHKQNVMDEHLSFTSHNVVAGDLIEIFQGYVTGGD